MRLKVTSKLGIYRIAGYFRREFIFGYFIEAFLFDNKFLVTAFLRKLISIAIITVFAIADFIERNSIASTPKIFIDMASAYFTINCKSHQNAHGFVLNIKSKETSLTS